MVFAYLFYSILPVLFEVVSGTTEEAVAKISIHKYWSNINLQR
jgi:hypothetical protein